jgi:hypothetical protein
MHSEKNHSSSPLGSLRALGLQGSGGLILGRGDWMIWEEGLYWPARHVTKRPQPGLGHSEMRGEETQFERCFQKELP